MMRAAHEDGRSKGGDGFSVIELLVALVILGLVMSMLPQTLQLASRAFRAADVIDARSNEAISIDFLASRLSQTMPVYRRSNDGLLAISFLGRERELSFVAPLSAGKDATGLAVFTIRPKGWAEGDPETAATSDAASKTVELVWQIFRADTNPDQPMPPVHSRELLPSSEGLAFRYRGPKPRDETGAFGGDEANQQRGPQLGDWQPQWTIRERLPSEIEITYKSVSGRLHTRVVELMLVTQR